MSVGDLQPQPIPFRTTSMRALQLYLLAAFPAMVLGSNLANAGYVQSWLNAEGGCKTAYYALKTDSSSLMRDGAFLGRSGGEWTDEMLEEFKKIYAECSVEIELPTNVPKSMMVVSSARLDEAQRLTQTIRNTLVEPARRKEKERIVAEQARQHIVKEEAKHRIAQAERLKAEQETGAAEQAKQGAERIERFRQEAEVNATIRTARLAQAKEEARRDQEMANEITRQVEAEEQNLAEVQRIAADAAAKRQAAEARLAKIRATTEAERSRQESPPIVAPLAQGASPSAMGAFPPERSRSPDQTVSPSDKVMGLDDFRLDYDRLRGQRVTLAGTLMIQGDTLVLMPSLLKGIANTDMIFVDWEHLPRDTRQRVIQDCRSLGCRATVHGRATDVMLNKGLRADAIQLN